MPSVRVPLGQWFDTTGPNMTPNTEVVGGSGDVDDLTDLGGDDTFVTVRAEEINTFLGVQLSSFRWFPEARPELPAFPANRNPRVEITVRHELIEAPVEITSESFRVQFMGPSASTVSATGSATAARVTNSPLLFGNPPPFTITEGRWDDIRSGDLELRIGSLRSTGSNLINPDTLEPYPAGTDVRINIYQVWLTVLWDSIVTPARRLYPRTDSLGLGIGRVYPPPNTPQGSGRSGPSSPY